MCAEAEKIFLIFAYLERSEFHSLFFLFSGQVSLLFETFYFTLILEG